jgi:hypothetical protein
MTGRILREACKRLDSSRFVSTRFLKDCDKAMFVPSNVIDKFTLPMVDVEKEQFKTIFNKVASDSDVIARLQMEGK